jgi:hypothetical protein
MTGPGTQSVTPTARVLVRAATTTLPSGAVRERYRREHLGELSALPTADQVHYAIGALATSWALRRALIKERDMTTTPTRPAKPLLCRLNLHHRWHAEHNLMGEPFRRCLKCGKDDPGPWGPPPGAVQF